MRLLRPWRYDAGTPLQGAAAKQWLADREAELCPCHTSTWCLRCRGRSPIIAYQNKAVIYDLLFKAAAEATLTIAAGRKRTHQVRSS